MNILILCASSDSINNDKWKNICWWLIKKFYTMEYKEDDINYYFIGYEIEISKIDIKYSNNNQFKFIQTNINDFIYENSIMFDIILDEHCTYSLYGLNSSNNKSLIKFLQPYGYYISPWNTKERQYINNLFIKIDTIDKIIIPIFTYNIKTNKTNITKVISVNDYYIYIKKNLINMSIIEANEQIKKKFTLLTIYDIINIFYYNIGFINNNNFLIKKILNDNYKFKFLYIPKIIKQFNSFIYPIYLKNFSLSVKLSNELIFNELICSIDKFICLLFRKAFIVIGQ
jgi:hypothetical protein